ncbi:glycosyltransferase N-terminal domain-containing protein [Vannielia sp.]|uniref:glycosyltransferase N-terminal domain-containing protein n=1 Tax=Vannielia sp. TaxID=2813045 RepID=UPI002628E724|nr:glycosyltransferase N-terminal domain-containing protein [Vannielia sp.]MDF1872292.1 glycosyltransferase N-terminal domain-containing protein [Vannielia sp.]
MTRSPLRNALFRRLLPQGSAEREDSGEAPPRPPGPLVWAHVTAPGEATALPTLARELASENPGVTLLVTSTTPPDTPPGTPLLWQPHPAPGRTSARRFLSHWEPDVALWLGRAEAAPLLSAGASHCPLTLVTSAPEAFSGLDRPTRTALRAVREAWVSDATSLRAARIAGIVHTRLAAPLTALADPPRCIESERAELAERFAARPLWFAVHPTAEELPAVLAAHHAALAGAHRALLILLPGAGCPDDARLTADLTDAGFATASRYEGDDPEDHTEIYLADRYSPEENGLWYRLAPVCFLGGTLAGPAPAEPPSAAAALGSAIIFGPLGPTRTTGLKRLATANGARTIAAPAAIADAVLELLSPDRAAELAQAAWTVISEDAVTMAALTNHLVAQLQSEGVA